MNTVRMLGIVLLVGGMLGLVYGGFNYMTQTRRTNAGPVHVAVNGWPALGVSIWASLAAVAGGALLLVTARKP